MEYFQNVIKIVGNLRCATSQSRGQAKKSTARDKAETYHVR